MFEAGMSIFILDPRLAADSVFIADGPMSQLRLIDDARFPWLVLVPRLTDAVEMVDLDGGQQRVLLAEINQAAKLLRSIAPCDKLNIAALGNSVRQLHVHVVARTEADAAWPGPVWGHGAKLPYQERVRNSRVEALQRSMAAYA